MPLWTPLRGSLLIVADEAEPLAKKAVIFVVCTDFLRRPAIVVIENDGYGDGEVS